MERRIASVILVGTLVLQACALPVRITGLEASPEVLPTEAPLSEAPTPIQPTPEVTRAVVTAQASQSTATPLPSASWTPKPTRSATKVMVTPTKAPSAADQTLELTPVYVLQPGSPSWLTNFTHPEAGCNWSGVGGQVFNVQNEPVPSLVMLVEGEFDSEEVRFLSLTGVAPIYGPGGYEIVLADQPVVSTGTLRIQVFDLAGTPLSESIAFNTFANCEMNLIIINFVDELPTPGALRYYLPVFFSSLVVE